jgi:hypothetical protein
MPSETGVCSHNTVQRQTRNKISMSFSRRNVTKSSRIPDYSQARAPVSIDHEETSNPKEIILPSKMTSPVANKKHRKAMSLNFQRENSARGLRSTLRREKNVSRGLGLGIHRESSVSRGLGFSNRTARLMTEARKEELQFDFPVRPRTKRQRQRQRDGDSDYEAPTRSNLKVVYNSATQKNNLVSDGKALSPIKKPRRPSVIFRRSPSFDVKEESFRTAISPISVIDDLSLSPEDRSKLRFPIKSTRTRIVFSSGFDIDTPKVVSPLETEKLQSPPLSSVGSNSKPKRLRELPALRRSGKSIEELIAKLGTLSLD